ncbi:MAG: NUDIX hydrolase [Clostridia bacterium]|nr:NUDIX hydrolase [Clostridia bacterium]
MNEKCVSSREIYKGRVVGLRVDDIITDKGVTAKREVISHNGGAAILAVKDGKILLEKQFRYPYGEVIWEIPAGKREGNEEFIATARRELEEETGLIPLDLKEILKIYPTPGYTNEVICVFYADDFKEGSLNFDDCEDILSFWKDEREVYEMIDRKEIKDGKSLAALLWYFSRKK